MTEIGGKIIVTVESEDREYAYEDLSVTFESTPDEILEALKPIILEDTGVNILEDGLYTVKKAENSGNIYIFPKSPAGSLI
jgi:hypothetical protein